MFSQLVGSGRMTHMQVVMKTLRLEEAELWTREMYAIASIKPDLLYLNTRWVTPDGKTVPKFPLRPIHYIGEPT